MGTGTGLRIHEPSETRGEGTSLRLIVQPMRHGSVSGYMTEDEPPSKTKIEAQKGPAADRFLQQPLVQVSIRQSPTRRVAGTGDCYGGEAGKYLESPAARLSADCDERACFRVNALLGLLTGSVPRLSPFCH
jgi:hypothetical protein